MDEKIFIAKKMRELRKQNNYTMKKMAEKIDEKYGTKNTNKSSISRAETGKVKKSTIMEMAEDYCEIFGLTKEQKEQFLKCERIAVVDTSALMKNPRLVEQLVEEYGKVVIPKVVMDELLQLKSNVKSSVRKKATEIIKQISSIDGISIAECKTETKESNDCRIIATAESVSIEKNCVVDIITDDIDYMAYLKQNDVIKAVKLVDYIAKSQKIIDMAKIMSIDNYYGDEYEKEYGDINPSEANAYMKDGNTLIISVVRNRGKSFEKKKEKIKWLIGKGADVNRRDNGHRYMPPLSHAVQVNDYEIFKFLLNECKADPNVGSKDPYGTGKLRQKNEGNMPLMVAAWEGKDKFVDILCKDPRTSINQQDSNGFTALIKAGLKGNEKCMQILKDAGADQKIVDIEGKNYEDHYREYCINRDSKKDKRIYK